MGLYFLCKLPELLFSHIMGWRLVQYVFSQQPCASCITIHDSYFLFGNWQPSHCDTKSKLFLISALLPADQNECEAPEQQSWSSFGQVMKLYLTKNSLFSMHAFEAQCNRSNICWLLRRCSGYYRCSKFPTLLRIFIAFGFTVSWPKKGLKHAMGIFYTIKK